jgi:hypothetical protein
MGASSKRLYGCCPKSTASAVVGRYDANICRKPCLATRLDNITTARDHHSIRARWAELETVVRWAVQPAKLPGSADLDQEAYKAYLACAPWHRHRPRSQNFFDCMPARLCCWKTNIDMSTCAMRECWLVGQNSSGLRGLCHFRMYDKSLFKSQEHKC